MERTIKANIDYKVKGTFEYSLEELGFDDTDNPTEEEIKSALSDYVSQVGAGIDACIDCEKIELVK